MNNTRKRQWGDSPESGSDSDATSESDNSPRFPKVARLDEPGNYSAAAQKIMSKMGFKKGTGLGLASQGIMEPVGLSKQRGRRGLGLIIEGLEEESVDWDPSMETIEVKESYQWIPTALQDVSVPNSTDLESWIMEGKRKEKISDETKFCDPEVLSSVLKSKSVFDSLEPEELRKARTRSNPFETIRGGLFQNRAAMKMANIDAIFDFMFTEPKTSDGSRPLVHPDELLYFADVCAGPGGFSEYVLWRKKWGSKGFGFTLKGSHDFKLEDFFAGPVESFETHYGVNGVDGDGDVFKSENIVAFRDFVLSNTQNKGVHFMMADGGFSVEGQENIQEILSKQLYLCQCLVALSIIRVQGHFVCKLFDLFTPFSVGLVYLMYLCFEKVTIFKPNTSRPANSERYIICKIKKENTNSVRDYLMKINKKLNSYDMDLSGKSRSNVDVVEIVPPSVIDDNQDFVDFITESNNSLGERQIVGLRKIKAFCKDPTLREMRQTELRDQCLELWKVPNEFRKAPRFENPRDKIASLLHCDTSLLNCDGIELNKSNYLKFLSSPFDWEFVVCGSSQEDHTFFLGLGRSKIYKYGRNKSGGSWQKLEDQLKFELPSGTLIYAEVTNEMRGERSSTRRAATIHIIDACFIGSEDLRGLDFKTRNLRIHMLADAINKFSRNDYVLVRAKQVYSLERLEEDVLSKLSYRICKGAGGTREKQTLTLSDRYFVPAGIALFRIVDQPFTIAFSKTHQRKYWFNTATGGSEFECPSKAAINFKSSFEKRIFWKWNEFGHGIDVDRPLHEGDPAISASDISGLLKKAFKK